MRKKTIVLAAVCTLLLGVTIGGTMAWFTDTSERVVNTFTVGNIDIELKEHIYVPGEDLPGETEVTENDNYHFVPGDKLPKDPFVRVNKESEECYVFVRIDEINNTVTDLTGDIIDYEVSEDWTHYDGEGSGRFFYKIFMEADINQEKEWYILKDNQVSINSGVTKEMVGTINGGKPQLNFRAAAVQKSNVADVKTAWEILPESFKE